MFNMGLSRNQLSDLAGYTPQWMRQINAKLPNEQKLYVPISEDSDKCDLSIFIKRWVDYNVARETSEMDLDYDQVKTEHEKAKKRKTELQVQQMEGALIPIYDVKRIWATVLENARKNFLQLPNQVAPQLLMMDNTERIAGIIGDAVRQALENIADTPLPNYVTDEEDEDE